MSIDLKKIAAAALKEWVSLDPVHNQISLRGEDIQEPVKATKYGDDPLESQTTWIRPTVEELADILCDGWRANIFDTPDWSIIKIFVDHGIPDPWMYLTVGGDLVAAKKVSCPMVSRLAWTYKRYLQLDVLKRFEGHVSTMWALDRMSSLSDDFVQGVNEFLTTRRV